jgi:hypothetical protein
MAASIDRYLQSLRGAFSQLPRGAAPAQKSPPPEASSYASMVSRANRQAPDAAYQAMERQATNGKQYGEMFPVGRAPYTPPPPAPAPAVDAPAPAPEAAPAAPADGAAPADAKPAAEAAAPATADAGQKEKGPSPMLTNSAVRSVRLQPPVVTLRPPGAIPWCYRPTSKLLLDACPRLHWSRNAWLSESVAIVSERWVGWKLLAQSDLG